MIGRRGLIVAVLVAFASGAAVGAAADRSEMRPALETCRQLLQQERPDACELIRNLGGLGGP